MLIDMTAPIRGLDGEPLLEGEKPVTLRTLVQTSLLASLPDDAHILGTEKARYFTLALAANADEVDLKVEDVATIKARIGKVATPLAVGRAYEMLDPSAP